MIWITKTGLGAAMPISFLAQQISGIMYLHIAFLVLYIWIVKKARVYKRLASSTPVQSVFIYIYTVLKNMIKSHKKTNSEVYAEMTLCMMTFNLHLKFLLQGKKIFPKVSYA